MSQLLKRSIRFARRQSVEAKNQLLGKYPDRYGFLDFYNYMNKRPEQKSSLEQEVGSLSERLFSNNNDKILVFHLTDRGFYSEINNLLNAAIYCLHNNIGMVVNSKHFLYKEKAGWDDYFERFWEDANNAEHTRYFDLHYRQSVELWNRVTNYNYETVTMPALDLEGNAFENKRSIAQLIYRLKPDVQALLDKRIEQFKLPKTFAACHISRGDKVGDMPGYPESERVDGSVYLDKVLEDFPDVRTLFVCSDAYQAVQEISECIHARGLNDFRCKEATFFCRLTHWA